MAMDPKYGKFYSHMGRIVCVRVPSAGYDTMLVKVDGVWVASDGQRFSAVDGRPLKVDNPVLVLDVTSIQAKAE